MSIKRYEVLRSHSGDKEYAVGDVREAREQEVKHLIPRCLRELGEGEEPTPKKTKPSAAKKANATRKPAAKKPLTQAQKDKRNAAARKRRAEKKKAKG